MLGIRSSVGILTLPFRPLYNKTRNTPNKISTFHKDVQKKLAGFRKSYLLIHNFLVKMQKSTFLKKIVLSVVLSNLNAGSNKLV